MRVLYYTSICLFGTALAIPVHSQGAQALSERQSVPSPGDSEPVADQPKTLGKDLERLFGERDSAPGAGPLKGTGAPLQEATAGLFGAGDAILNGPGDAIAGLLGGGGLAGAGKGESQPKQARQLLGGPVTDLANAAADLIEGRDNDLSPRFFGGGRNGRPDRSGDRSPKGRLEKWAKNLKNTLEDAV